MEPSEFKSQSDPSDNSNAMVLWKFDNPYANYKKDAERIFVLDGYTLRISQKLTEKIDITKNTGNIVWDGAYMLSKYLVNHVEGRGRKKLRFLELGSGCGLVGLAAWIKGGYVVCTGTKTDIEHTRTNVEKNVELVLSQQQQRMELEVIEMEKARRARNARELLKEDIDVRVLDWRKLPTMDLITDPMHLNNSKTFDIILASELLYLPELHRDLVKTMMYYCHGKKSEVYDTNETRVLGIYKQRGLGEDAFFEIARVLGKFEIEWIDTSYWTNLHPILETYDDQLNHSHEGDNPPFKAYEICKENTLYEKMYGSVCQTLEKELSWVGCYHLQLLLK
ncbi:16203_t:CDS:2 [Acaulospora morrowiae]|uniref:16203_t:CDS:1 n=1 Tax=Acaulospora morrowiae TaxID=94023 RepID=A0A9N9CQ76_9GLOM|nr:16203_t:CDS:2 [Acaulospora morrowiae]